VHLSEVWFVPLAVGAAGALGLSLLAVRLRQEVDSLQRAMRPLRTDHRRHRPTD
jgi:hypothetical protein